MANFFDIADNWNKVLQREAQATIDRQAKMLAELTEAARPLVEEVERRVATMYPIGAWWDGHKRFDRDAYVTKRSDVKVSFYEHDYDSHDEGTTWLKTVPQTFTVRVVYKSVPCAKKGRVVEGQEWISFYIDKNGDLVRNDEPSWMERPETWLSGSQVRHEVRDFSEDWS